MNMADKRFKSMDTIKRNLAMAFLLFVCQGSASVFSQITERPRPKEWDNLVEGSRFIDRFLPMSEGKLSAKVWGGENVVPRFIDNGIEDDVRSYWGGNIIKGDECEKCGSLFQISEVKEKRCAICGGEANYKRTSNL